ncbi:MAG: DUF1360 domain-containing protein [Verrucomicrobia bacterium]|nr:DUF1360 domain-containing protein [Verrucomicrobiota bacterium]
MALTLLLSIVTASISFTLCEMQLFLGVRQWISRQSKFFGKLASCAYCLGHWIAFFLVAIYRPRLFNGWWPLDYFLTALIIAWASALQWVIMCWLMDRTDK